MVIKGSRSSLSLLLVSVALGCGGSASVAKPPASSASTSSEPSSAPTPVAATSSADRVTALDWPAAENPRARYIVAVGMPTAHDDSVTPEHLAYARLHAARTLRSIDDLELAPAHFDRAALVAESTKRKILGVFFECGVTLHDVDERGTHFAVNVAVVDLRTEDIVASLTGRATAPGPTSGENEQLALEGALEVAMRGVPTLLASLGASSQNPSDL